MTMNAESPRLDIGKRQQLPDEVAGYVRELILSGQVRPGELLRLEAVASALGVSSTPVREGLLALTREGFVSQAPRRGFIVAPFTRDDVRDLFWAQGWLSGELAARAAGKMTAEQLDRMEQLNKDYEAASMVGDMESISNIGHAFHREVNLAGESIRLATLVGSVVRALPLRFYSTIDGSIDASVGEHPAILEALRQKDSAKVRTLMEEHISKGADRLIKSLEVLGLWSENSQN